MSSSYFAEFVTAECCEDVQERLYARWLRKLENILGCTLDENGEAWDLYANEYSPAEAAVELSC